MSEVVEGSGVIRARESARAEGPEVERGRGEGPAQGLEKAEGLEQGLVKVEELEQTRISALFRKSRERML